MRWTSRPTPGTIRLASGVVKALMSRRMVYGLSRSHLTETSPTGKSAGATSAYHQVGKASGLPTINFTPPNESTSPPY
uniref:Uncharacterized protein n=1 Tax=uncultured marine virus TaxID=186617 RepID=A0A0F7LCF6_9VIRU|nr:hypothetical protein [uncultured marine virus]